MKRPQDHPPSSARRLPAVARRLGVLSGVLLIGGCPGGAPPIAEDALGAYLSRHGIATPTTEGAEAPRLAPVAPPVTMARRLSITVVSARDLPDLDSGPGVTDPYVLLQVDGQRHRTTTIEGSQSPVWGDSFILDVGPSPVLELTLKDEDTLSSDETLGVVSKVLDPIPVGTTVELEIPFREGAGGYVTIRLTGLGPRDGKKGP